MKNPKGILTGFAAALWMFMGTDVMGQGSLTPPGAPGETMKTLAQVEPRTPISSLPYTISEPGSYYVTGNLSSTGDGIIIESSGVTVDLMGFSLTGDGPIYPYFDLGIKVIGSTNAMIENLVIKGGRISGFYQGLYFEYTNNSRIKELVVSGNTWFGVYLDGYDGQCNGNTISGCTISGNGDNGVSLYGNSGQCNGNTIVDCTISGNGVDGVTLYGFSGQCNGNTIADCTISGNGDDGVSLYGSDGQCNGNTIRGNTINKNEENGVTLDNVDHNRVEANHVAGTMQPMSYGIRTSASTGNFILDNTCVNHETNFSIDPDDTFVPVETASLAGQATIEAAIAAQPSDPHTPITSLPTTISQPGSYYLVGNLASTGHGIIIQASGVTLDLGGFSITGNGSTGYYGIYVAGTSTNNPVDKLLVRGGSICDFGNGLRAKFTENSRFEQLVVSGSTSHGFLLTGNTGLCNGSTVVDCSVSGSTGVGFYLDGRNGECNENRLVDCTTRNNGGTGLYLTGDGGQCDGNTIRGNAASKNSGRGIYISYANGNRVEANHVWGTTGASSYGIQTGNTTTGNFILKNTSVGQVNNFALDIDDTYGPIVSGGGPLGSTGDASHPWANFSR